MASFQWFILGVISMLAINAFVYIHMVVQPKWYTIPLLLVAVVDLLFGLAWGISSYLEGYTQSSAMGLVIFSGSGLILGIVTVRFLVLPDFMKAKSST